MMISLDEILSYLPIQHGEHGVDASIHMLIHKQASLHEAFSNPPGASWAQFDIIRPMTNEIYRWDHMPRVPEAKRPDWVIQLNEKEVMNFLLIESKPRISDIYDDMGKLLIQFFTGSPNFLGLRKRPAWHRKPIEGNEWKFISPEEKDDIRFWFREYEDKLIRFWPGFAFALEPEYYPQPETLDRKAILGNIRKLLTPINNLKVIIAVGWCGKYHTPFIISDYSDDFKDTKFASELTKLLGPALFR